MHEYEEKGFVSRECFQFPNIINLEVYRGACPCECVHCPVGRVPAGDRAERFGVRAISPELFRKVIDEMSGWPHSTVRLHSVGEPILWDGLVPALSYLKASGVRGWIFTSLVTQRTDLLEALCSGCQIVEVSVNSISGEDYLATKGIDRYALVTDNIRYMSRYIRENRLGTRLVVSRVQSDSEENDNAFTAYWKQTGLVADAFVRKYHNYNNIIEEKGERPARKEPCLVHWMRFNISCDGTVVTCFNELFRDHLRDDVVLGNLANTSIYDIWHSESMNRLREAELNGYATGDFREDFPCRNCFSCQAYDGKRETSEHQINALK